MQTETSYTTAARKKALTLITSFSLVATSVFGFSSSASASEMAPIIEFDGNVLASSVVHSEIGERPVQYQVALNPAPLSRVMTTNRAGYSFGGWSYVPGGPAVTTLQTSSHTTTRMWLYAVWNTKINLDSNGGKLVAGGASTLDYRFNSTLNLPAASPFKKKGFAFAGWTSAPNSGAFATTYRAAGDAVGNPTFYAAWKKTVNFKAGRATGTVPASITYLEGANRISLPTASQISLTRAGFEFVGWSTTRNGKVVKNPSSYLPKKAEVTLHAVWKKVR